MTDAIALIQKLAAASFGVLTALLLFGSYLEIWVWGKQYRELKAESKARLEAAERDRDEWKHMALSAAGIAETSVGTLARRG